MVSFLRELVLCPAPKCWPLHGVQASEVNAPCSLQADAPEQQGADDRDTKKGKAQLRTAKIWGLLCAYFTTVFQIKPP